MKKYVLLCLMLLSAPTYSVYGSLGNVIECLKISDIPCAIHWLRESAKKNVWDGNSCIEVWEPDDRLPCIPVPVQPDEATDIDLPKSIMTDDFAGTWYSGYWHEGLWKVDHLFFGSEAVEPTADFAVSAGRFVMTGSYNFVSTWELISEPEGLFVRFWFPARGWQWLSICHISEYYYKIAWSTSRGDMLLSLRNSACEDSMEFFFRSEEEALRHGERSDL
ncbi:MAG: hypothetical protein B6245_21280 [Desulfobacteraceae bacterium 4572_88]|nr:MAG: hypothetical protein B6245_21280 [Desulfobacteraceae bacterium 4572_88]